MNFSNAKIRRLISDEKLTLNCRRPRITVPLIWYPTLVQATAAAERIENLRSGRGIHWPLLDYHLSVEGLLRGARETEGVTRRLLAKA